MTEYFQLTAEGTETPIEAAHRDGMQQAKEDSARGEYRPDLNPYLPGTEAQDMWHLGYEATWEAAFSAKVKQRIEGKQ